MAFKIMLTEDGDGAPVILCDICGQRIKRASEAAYAWVDDLQKPGTLVDITFLHRRGCMAVYHETRAGMSDAALDFLPLYLINGIGIELEAAMSRSRFAPGLDLEFNLDFAADK